MKPIIIEVRDDKVVMDVIEFKKHIEEAYQQGRRDSSLTSSSYIEDPYWWRDLTIKNLATSSTSTDGSTPKVTY